MAKINEKVKNGITELVFILDRSGSMQGLESDTAGGFNTMIEEQKKKDGKVYVSTILFNNDSFVLHDREDISSIKPMEAGDFRTFGCTALIDALGGAIHHMGNIHKYARKEDVPEHTIFVIMTDGLENASHIYSSDKVKKMVEKQKEKYGWEFFFMGANIDAVETAGHYGIDEDRAVKYKSDSVGTELNYMVMSEAVGCIRERKKVDRSWAEKIRKDEKSR